MCVCHISVFLLTFFRTTFFFFWNIRATCIKNGIAIVTFFEIPYISSCSISRKKKQNDFAIKICCCIYTLNLMSAPSRLETIKKLYSYLYIFYLLSSSRLAAYKGKKNSHSKAKRKMIRFKDRKSNGILYYINSGHIHFFVSSSSFQVRG